MYKRISYSIIKGDDTEGGKLAAEAFIKYRDRCMNGENNAGENNAVDTNKDFDLPPAKKIKPSEKNENQSKGKSKGLFDGMVFVFCESIPKHKGKSYTHAQLSDLISKEGGRVRKRLPSAKSTKKYTVLTNTNVLQKKGIPLQIREAVRNSFNIVNYTFVLDTLMNGTLLSMEDYFLDVSQAGKVPVTKVISTEQKHFGKVSMLSIIKKRVKRKKFTSFSSNKRLIHHPAMYYVYKNLKAEKRSFNESTNLLRHYHKKWKTLCKKEVSQITEEWQSYVQKAKLARKSQPLPKPAYSSFISPVKQNLHK
ncbi:hypothetical protein HOLleu_03216 [Holothuria leucospilota]|uniref:BRCT domain-containing protein n=1 Tax=Holothuria leucospilota TaxID=206669 RepID=A0A9Q1CSA1_HOLLE|nr:hypothetical protein HOLleu_03216 [Holothuria leucospilota]